MMSRSIHSEMRSLLKFLVFLLFTTLFASPLCAQSGWLEAKGKKIVNASTGQEVILRAVGLGNWALQEGYMLNPQNCKGCPPGPQWQMKKIYYDEGQTPARVEAFYRQWRDNFITKADIDYIASLGFNSVRLPMHYELFLTSEQRAVRNHVISNIDHGQETYKDSLKSWYDNDRLFNDPGLEGFRMIDNLLSWCKDNGMYVILDLHAAPGGQGTDKNIADIFHDNNLWLFPVFQDVTDRLWDRISRQYLDEPAIAFYDLVNEPNHVPGGGQAIHTLFQRLITTIRNNGDKHMLMIEGDGWGNNYNHLEPSAFSPNQGLVYNAHRYWIAPEDDGVPDPNPNQINRMSNLVKFRDTYNVPVWVGETGENNNEWLRQNIEKLDREGIGWCHWTYKRFDVDENAALMRIGGNYPTDGAAVMAEVLENIKFENCIPNSNTIAAVIRDLPTRGASQENYKSEENIAYYPDSLTGRDPYISEKCRLDIHYPQDMENFPTVIWFHGGGLTGGSKEIPEELKNNGFAVVGAGYRLSPGVKSVQCIEDAAAAISWVFEHIREYGGDPGLIFVSGHSAGGYLAMMTTLDKSYLEAHHIDADKIAGVIPFSGQAITHFNVRKERGIKDVQPVIDEFAPLYHVRADAPPMLLITGDREMEMLGRYEENAYLLRMMKLAGHEDTELYELEGYGHNMVYPAFPLLIGEIKKRSEEINRARM